jgi:DNA polymerase III epsilon subunit-like protein
MNFKDRKLAVTDLETSGDIPGMHEILEIGLIVCDPKTFEIFDTMNMKIKPEHIENAVPAALERNGYKKENWTEAVSLKKVMEIYSEKTKDAVFYAYNVTFDWGFILDAFKQTGIKNNMDYHRFDIMSMVFQKFNKNMDGVSLNIASKLLGIPEEPIPHNALNGAAQALEVLKKL